MKLSLVTCLLLLFSYQLTFVIVSCHTNQVGNLKKLIKSQKSGINRSLRGKRLSDTSFEAVVDNPFSSGPISHVIFQDGSMEADKIEALPGQPSEGVDFNQYGGYVTVDANNGRALFYYFVESPQNYSTKPLVLWLNGGPGCSSLGFGAMEELGPFRVNGDGKTLFQNEFAWNNEANVLFLESPAGVGFSYSNTTTDYKVGDNRTAWDSYTFLVNWLERFPQYKTSDFFITGESYAGHYIPQLASTILSQNKVTTQTKINLKGIAIGNAWIDTVTGNIGGYDYLWTHGLNSDETNAGIHKHCDDFTVDDKDCDKYETQSDNECGDIDEYNIYAPNCNISESAPLVGSVKDFDPCSGRYVQSYLNLAEVQAALHVIKPTVWTGCSHKITEWLDSPLSVLPIIQELMGSGISMWLYSGDIDAVVSVTATRYALNTMNLTIESPFRAWYSNEDEVGGYVVGYNGNFTFATVRGAGHEVPSYQPQRSLVLLSSFIQGMLPPAA